MCDPSDSSMTAAPCESLQPSSDDDCLSSDDDDLPTVPASVQAVHIFLRTQAALTRRLEAIFAALMIDVASSPIAVFLLGICAGGALGLRVAAFSAGYVSTALFPMRCRPLCDLLVTAVGAHEAYAAGALDVLPVYCLGRESSRFLSSRRLSPERAAALSVHAMGALSPTWTTLSLHCVLMATKNLPDAFVSMRRWFT